MNSMFSFLFSKDGKSQRDRQSKSQKTSSSTEEKLKKLPDAKLSDDSIGKSILELWKYCEDYCSSSLENRCSGKFNVTDQKNFENFLLQLVNSFEEVITNSQLNNPLVESGFEGPPASINDTWGLPTDMVISMANFFLSYVCINSAELPAVVTFPNDVSETLLMFDSLEFSFSRVLDPVADFADISDWIMIARYNFLLITNAMATICSWPHNRRVISQHFGRGFCRVFIQMARSLVSKLEDVIIGYNENCADRKSTNALEEDGFFLLHSLLGIVRCLTRSMPNMEAVTSRCQINILPQQPWRGADVSTLGFCDMAKLINLVREYSGQEKPNINHLEAISTFTFFSTTGRSTSTSGYDDAVCSFFASNSFVNEWSTSFVEFGAVQVLVSLLAKLTFLSRSLATTSRYIPHFANDYGNRTTKRSAVCWSQSVALQCEVLFGALSYLDFLPNKVRPKFSLCNGAGILSSVFSMQDSPPQEKMSESDFYLGYHRGLLCLEINKEIVGSAVNNDSDIDFSLTDTLLTLDGLPLFLAWLEAHIISHDWSRSICKNSPSSFRNIHLECDTSHNIPVAIPLSELWPWEYSKSEVLIAAVHTGDVERDKSVGEEETLPVNVGEHYGALIDVDLLDHGNVMLRYAESSSLMEKYIVSMKRSGIYSLSKAVTEVFEGPSASDSMAVLPWFICGPVAKIWDHFFESLLKLCQATDYTRNFASSTYDQDSKGNVIIVEQHKKSEALTDCYCSIFASILSSLRMCAEGQSSATSKLSKPPFFQFHMIHFIGVLIQLYPAETLSVCRDQKLWSVLSSSRSFLMGGIEPIRALLRSCQVQVDVNVTDKPGLNGKLLWSLHNDHNVDHFVPRTGREGGTEDSTVIDNDLYSKEDTVFEMDETSISGDSDTGDSKECLDIISASDGDGSSEKLNDSYTEDCCTEYGVSGMSYFPRNDSAELQVTNSLERTWKVPLEDEFSDQTRIEAFTWLSLFDSTFQMMSLAVETIDQGVIVEDDLESRRKKQETNTLPKNISLPGSTTELYSMLQSIGRDTPDHVVLQTMNWIRINLIKEYRAAVRKAELLGVCVDYGNMYTEKYKHILFKCLSLCKFQLLSSCDSSTTKLPSIADDNCPPFWIGEEIAGIHQKRPFLWSSRAAVIELIVTIVKISPGSVWCKAFLPKGDSLSMSVPSPASDRLSSRMTVNTPGYNHETNLTPKHVTLLLLLLDPRCRNVSLYILTELLHACACLNYNIPVNLQDERLLQENIKQDSSRSKMPLLAVSNDTDMSKSIFAAIFHDIIKCLFVYHIKYSMLQPAWCDGGGIVSSICQWIRCFLGNPDRIRYLPHYQSMMLSYGQLGPHHYLLNWIKPRPHIFRELFLSVDQCIKKSGHKSWDEAMKIRALRHFLSMLTALMLESGVTKHKFSMLMLLKKHSKNKAKVVSNPSNDAAVGTGSLCNFHDVAAMIITLEKSPSLETLLLLFDMLLDGPKQDNRSLVESEIIPEKGMFFDEDSDVCMSNMVIIPIILLLIPSCNSNLQTCILLTLKNLLTGRFSLVNLSKCSDMQPPVLDSLLDLFLRLEEQIRPLCLDVVQVIGKHNISVAQLKRIFRLMHIQTDYRPKYTSLLLRCLRGMVSTVKCPKHFFLFEGSPESGLRVPPILRWPASTSYSFCFWFCVRSPSKMFATSSDSQSTRLNSSNIHAGSFSVTYRPTLLSFRQGNGIGLEVYLRVNSVRQNTYSLVLETFKDVGESIQSSIVVISSLIENVEGVDRSFPIRGDEWYFLAFSHNAATFRSKSEIFVLLNNHFTRKQLSFPRFSGEIKKPLFGNSSGEYSEPGYVTSLTGQMGSIYMFSDCFTENQMRKLYSIGYNISKGLDNYTTASLEAISSAILLAYNPGIWNGNYFLNMAPAKNAKVWGSQAASLSGYGDSISPGSQSAKTLPSSLELSGSNYTKMNACMLPGTFRCTFCDMRDALDCLGGGRVLIPLFAQFDLPTLGQDGNVDYAVDPMLALEVVNMLFLLRRDSGQGKSFLKYAGFHLISFFLERISPRHLTLELLNVFIANAELLRNDREWYDGVVKYILLDFKLWMFAPFEVQQHLFIHLLGLCETETAVMREILNIRELFDALYVIYSKSSFFEKNDEKSNDNEELFCQETDSAEIECEGGISVLTNQSVLIPTKNPTTPKSVLVTQHFFHEVTGDVVGKRLEGKELDEVRRLIFSVIYALLTGEKHGHHPSFPSKRQEKKSLSCQTPTEEEIQCIMYYISHEKEDICKIQGLQLLVQLLDINDSKFQLQILGAMSTGVKVYPLLGLVVHCNPKIRCLSFLALCNVIQMAAVLGRLPAEKSVGTSAKPDEISKDREYSTMLDEEEQKSSQQAIESSEDALSGKSSITSPDTTASTSQSDPAGVTPTLRPSRQQSFSFIPPSLSLTLRKKGDAFAGDKDTLSDIGIPISTLHYVILWVQKNLIGADAVNSRVLEARCEVIITIMTRTMTGKSSTYLLHDINEIFDHNDHCNLKSPKKRRNSYSKSRTTSGKCSNENLFETVFCIPSIVPVLLNFISQDIVPYSLRFSTLVLLKTKLQSFQNCDLFLQIPQWQTAMFELLINEQKRVCSLQALSSSGDKHLGSPSGDGNSFKNLRAIEKELDRSTGILQTGLRMLCDLFLYGVEYGCPAPDYIICRPADESSYAVPKPTPISMIQAIGRGERRLGVKILQETMSFLRCYAERGDLDIELIGMSLLQQIVSSLNLRNDSWNSDSAELPHHRHIKIRVFNSACWLTSFFIVEFLTLPVVQSYSKFHFRSNENCDFATNKAPFTLVEDDVNKKLFSDSFEYVGTESLSDDDLTTDHKLSSSDTDLQPSTSESPRRRSSSLSSIPVLSRGRSMSPLTNQNEGSTDSFWGLYGSLLALLESLNPNLARKGAAGIQIAFKAGLRNSQTMLHQMNETMKEAMGPQGTDDDSNVEKTLTGSVIPIHRLASQISWRIVRVVCNIYFETGRSRHLLNGHSQKSQLEAVGYMNRSLANLEKSNRKSFEFESLHSIVKVVEVLRFTSHKPHDHWIAASFNLLKLTIKKIKPSLHRMLTNPPSKTGDNGKEMGRGSSGVWNNSLSELVGFGNEPSVVDETVNSRRSSATSLTFEDISSEFMDVDNMKTPFFDVEEDRRPPHSHHSYSMSMSDYTLGQLNSIMGYSNWADTSPSSASNLDDVSSSGGVSWAQWEECLRPIVERGMEMEDMALSNSLTELGMHKQTQQIELMLAEAKITESKYFAMLSSRSESFMKKATEHEMNSLQRLLKTSGSMNKRNAARWNTILEELANERGPWGVGAEEYVEVCVVNSPFTCYIC